MRKTFITIFILVILLVSLFLYYKEGLLAVNPKNNKTQVFIIKKGENVIEIAKNLENAGLIRNKIVFFFLIKRLGIDNRIQAGDFRLNPSMNAREIAESLTKGTLDVWVTIIEGLRKEEIAQILSHEFNIPEQEFIELSKEGYLFPDTYLVPRNATAGAVLEILENNFNKKYDQTLRSQARLKGLTDKEVITLASIVEKEARDEADRVMVASILLKRYRADRGLDIDATIQYALGYQIEDKTWWKKFLSSQDLKIDSLYNTYKYRGLPPGPISSPGLSSIQAVISADINSPYWYYLSDKSGRMHYSKNLDEHNANVRKYLR